MKRLALGLVLTAALLLPGLARAGTVFGVTEDAGKYSHDGGAAFFSRLHDLGMTQNAVSVQWDPDRPNVIVERALLDRLVPNAARSGIRLVFSVYFTRPNAVTATPTGSIHFAAFLRTLARTYPDVKDFVVGNEPNYGPFWQPQFASDGSPAAGAAYEDLLARSYDALKSVDPRINVIGLGLAARGNDRPDSRSPSTSPVLFLRDLGNAYRRSGRTRPLMDSFAYHPYPASDLDTVATKQSWPSAGMADLGRLKQAVWDAFHDTAQPTFESGLPLRITEIGWQAAIPAAQLKSYDNSENVRTTDEATQARIYGQVVRELVCDPAVTEVLFFHLIDESDLRGFQSGLMRADGSLRPAYGAVKAAIADTGGRCGRSTKAWRHTEEVVGASVGFAGNSGFEATADEGAAYRAAYLRVTGVPTAAERVALERSLIQQGTEAAEGMVPAGARVEPTLELPKESGTYVQAVAVSALADPARTSFFVSEPIAVGDGTQDSGEPTQHSHGVETAQSEIKASAAPREVQFSVVPAARGPQEASREVRLKLAQAARQHSQGPNAAAFRPNTPREEEAQLPGQAEPQEPEEASAAPAPAVSLDPRQPKKSLPLLFTLLLAGAALSAVVTIRLLGR